MQNSIKRIGEPYEVLDINGAVHRVQDCTVNHCGESFDITFEVSALGKFLTVANENAYKQLVAYAELD